MSGTLDCHAQPIGACRLVDSDHYTEVIDVARRRATVAGQCYWARFVTADLNTFVPHERFDAVVARLILFRQGERATFSRLSACVRPNGVIMVVLGKRTATPWRRPLSWRAGCEVRQQRRMKPEAHTASIGQPA
jgi:trans-aconitate methyltransferase